ncbi:MAG TPA: hypothetical protein VF463_10720 [Sphingobium sp.]
MLARLKAVLGMVLAEEVWGTPAADIIRRMVAEHGGSYRVAPTNNTLTAGGVSATCTWSKDVGLLAAWRRNATVRLSKEGLA